jgi:hypothetical protein
VGKGISKNSNYEENEHQLVSKTTINKVAQKVFITLKGKEKLGRVRKGMHCLLLSLAYEENRDTKE